MIGPDKLEAESRLFAAELNRMGKRTWQCADDWARTDRPDAIAAGPDPADPAEVGQINGRSERQIDERREDEWAHQTKQRLAKATKQIEAGMREVRAIMAAANKPNPKRVETDWCRSCMRDQGHTEPTHQGRYRDACRFCGEWRAAHGEWPPMHVIRWRHKHPGQRLPVHVVEQAG